MKALKNDSYVYYIPVKTFLLLSVLLFIVQIFGCKIEDKETGTLSLNISTIDTQQDETKTILPEIDMNVNSYDIVLNGPEEESLTANTDSSGLITIDDLAVGEWTLDVNARNSNGQAIGGKHETVQILAHQIVNCEIIVIPYEGFGSLKLNITWDDFNGSTSITGRLESSLNNITPIEFSLNEGSNLYENDAVPAGYYTLNVTLYNDGDACGGAVEVVRVVTGEITEANIHVINANANGDANIVIIPEMNDPIEISLLGVADMIEEGQTFTVTAITNDVEEPIFSWYIDGTMKLSGSVQNSYTIPDDLSIGNHRLDVAVFSSDGLRGGSSTHLFEIISVSNSIPVTPSNLILTVISQTQIDISWTDNSDNESGFRLERAPDNNGVAGTFSEIATVPSNNELYNDSGLEAETRYYYRISAFNSLGNSGYTSEISAITDTAYTPPVIPEGYTIGDHIVARESVLRSIPSSYIDYARNNFHIAYQHTSHGSHVTRGMYGLERYKSGDEVLFAIERNNPQPNALDMRDYWADAPGSLSSYGGGNDLGYYQFVQGTRNYLDDPANLGINIVMWSWCSIVGYDMEGYYLPGMQTLIDEYGVGGSNPRAATNPVTFIFMTGHAEANSNVGEGAPKNQADLIVNYCNTNEYFCLDYYNIDTHDMYDNYYEDAGDNGDSTAYGGNFYQDWQDANDEGVGWYYNIAEDGSIDYGAHTTQHITANRKAYAMWWILARIAGWDGVANE